MKVAYFIFSHEKGLGGHYRSLKVLIEGWKDYENLQSDIINIGIKPSPVLQDMPNYRYYSSSLRSMPKTFVHIYNLMKRERYDLIHAYDSIAYFPVRIFSYFFKIRSFYTKCGGPNVSYIPKAADTILFSKENLDYLERQRKDDRFYLIPNRVKNTDQDTNSINVIKNKYNLRDRKIILRIGNINGYYKNTIEASFKLTEYLRNTKNVNAILVLIGTTLDDTLDTLRNKYSNIETLVLDDKKYTLESARFISLSDYNVATGRGAMESIGLCIPTYLYSENSDLPVRVDRTNFMTFLNSNFSERNTAINEHMDGYLDPNSDLINFFNEYLYYKNGNQKLINIYNTTKDEGKKIHIIDLCKNMIKYIGVNLHGISGLKHRLKRLFA